MIDRPIVFLAPNCTKEELTQELPNIKDEFKDCALEIEDFRVRVHPTCILDVSRREGIEKRLKEIIPEVIFRIVGRKNVE